MWPSCEPTGLPPCQTPRWSPRSAATWGLSFSSLAGDRAAEAPSACRSGNANDLFLAESFANRLFRVAGMRISPLISSMAIPIGTLRGRDGVFPGSGEACPYGRGRAMMSACYIAAVSVIERASFVKEEG